MGCTLFVLVLWGWIIEEQQSPECMVCMSAPWGSVLRPCNHGGVCAECGPLLERCHICSQVVESVYVAPLAEDGTFQGGAHIVQKRAPLPDSHREVVVLQDDAYQWPRACEWISQWEILQEIVRITLQRSAVEPMTPPNQMNQAGFTIPPVGGASQEELLPQLVSDMIQEHLLPASNRLFGNLGELSEYHAFVVRGFRDCFLDPCIFQIMLFFCPTRTPSMRADVLASRRLHTKEV